MIFMKTNKFLLIAIVFIVFASCKKEKTNDETPDKDSIVVVEIPDTVHTAKTSIDWEGEYKGILPCEDCDGMETTILLNFDNTFVQTVNYIGKGGPYESKGSFEWDETGNSVVLKFDDGSQAKYMIGEGKISLLDDYGNSLESDEYVLRK